MGPGLRSQPKASQKNVQSVPSWKWWTHSETLALIDVWGGAMDDHCKTYKGKRILPSSAYQKMAARLDENGIKRSVEQIREKIKTLKKSFWANLAKNSNGNGAKLNGQRQSVIERMRRVLQENGHMAKGKYTWKRSEQNTPGQVQRKRKRGEKVSVQIQEEEDEDEEEEEEVLTTVEPDHVHGSWGEMNGGETHCAGASGGDVIEGEIGYNYSLCQVLETMMNRFLHAQRESEERFLELEEERVRVETERWETLQKRDTEVLHKLLQMHDRWRKEDREQELRMWAALASKVGGKSSSINEITPFTVQQQQQTAAQQAAMSATPPQQPLQWQFTGTFKPSTASSPSISPTID